MRWIADSDKERLERAHGLCGLLTHTESVAEAYLLLGEVLSNMRRLEVEQPPQQPRIAPLSLEHRRAIYPERYR